MAAALPGFLVLDRYLMCPKSLPPAIEVFGGDAEGEMARPPRTVRRQMIAPERRFRPEDEEHGTVPNLQEDVPPGFLSTDRQAEHVPIETLGLIEVVGIDPRFHKALDRSHARLNWGPVPSRGLAAILRICPEKWPRRKGLARVSPVSVATASEPVPVRSPQDSRPRRLDRNVDDKA